MPNRAQRRAAAHAENKSAAAAQPSTSQPEMKSTTTSSQAQIDANRANAQKSTGPSETGKAASCQNRRYHGLAGAFIVMPWEDPAQFESLRDDLRTEWNPETIIEQSYVDRLAEHMWLRQRCANLFATCYNRQPSPKTKSQAKGTNWLRIAKNAVKPTKPVFA